MAATQSHDYICSLVEDETLELEIEADNKPDFRGLVVCGDTLIVVDYSAYNIQFYSCHDGKLQSTAYTLESNPIGVCLISKTEVAVCLMDSKIVILYIRSFDVKLVKTLTAQTGFNYCHSVAKVNYTDQLIISGVNTHDMLCWCVVSLKDGHVNSSHPTFKLFMRSLSHLAIKDNLVYLSYFAEKSAANGVYAYDVCNPYTHKFLYQHHELKSPWGLTVDRRDFIFVCDKDSNKIHQLTNSGQLVTIHTVSSQPYDIFYEDKHDVLYTTSLWSKGVTRYKLEYLHRPGFPIEILNMDDRSIQRFENALNDGKEIIYSIRVMIVGHMGAGKTTLVKRLLGEELKISERHSTEGIDVYVNCIDVSLLTHEWKRKDKDSELDYELHRFVNVLNENYRMGDRVVNNQQVEGSHQRERNDHSPDDLIADYEENIEVLHQHSPKKNIDQNYSSTASLQEDSHSTAVQKNFTTSEINTMPVSVLEGPKKDLLREILTLLKENPDKAKQDIRTHARLSIWDFAGQYAFYTTHQMFLTKRAIYLLVSDVSGQITDLVEDECYFDTEGKIKCKVHDLAEVWLNSIHSCAPPDRENRTAMSPASSYKVIPPPVILVGTHVDQIPQPTLITMEEFGEALNALTDKRIRQAEHKLTTMKPLCYRSIKKGVTCADPMLLHQVLHSSTQDTLSSRSILERNCQTLGLKIHGEIPANGNCFFEAVSSQLKRLNCPVQISPEQLRRVTVAFLKTNRIMQVSAGNIDLAEFMCNESYEEYCERMAKDREWADHIVVVAVANSLQRDIMIVTSSPSSGNDENIAWVVGQTNFQGDPILLGHIWEHHYESLEPTDSTYLDAKYCWQAETMLGSDENDAEDEMGKLLEMTMPYFTGDISGSRNPPHRSIEAQRRNCRERGEKYLKEIRSYLSDNPAIVHLVDEDFAIDNTFPDSKLEELKTKIVEVASQQPYWREEIPTRWFLLEQQLMRLRDAGTKVIPRSTVEELNKEGTIQITESEELDLFLEYLHERGTIIYFKIKVLRDNIVLEPKWLIDALKLLINANPNLPEYPTENGAESKGPAIDADCAQKWSDFREKGMLSIQLVEAIWSKDKHPELYYNKDHILLIMEQLNIIAKPMSFSENGVKEENYYLTPCMLRQESPKEIFITEQNFQKTLRCIFTGKYLPPPIFHRLLAACIARWPVAKKKVSSENLIFCGCCVFDLDLFHRLTLHYKKYVVFARVTRVAIDDVRDPDPKFCTTVRRFITKKLSKITSYLGENLQYELNLSPPFQTWFADEGHAPDSPITPEHMNFARFRVALVTVGGNVMRAILSTYFPVPYKDIYEVIKANRLNLVRNPERQLFNNVQILLIYPDPMYMTTVGSLDSFDISVLYTLIRNVSTVPAPITKWGCDPCDHPRDTSLGASVERIRSYRNRISFHTADAKINKQDFEDYWSKFETVLHDIETIIGGHLYSQELEKQKRQVISFYEAC